MTLYPFQYRQEAETAGTWPDPDAKMMDSIREEEEKRIWDLQTKK